MPGARQEEPIPLWPCGACPGLLAGGGGELLSTTQLLAPLTLLQTSVTLALYCKLLSAVFGFVLFRGFLIFFPPFSFSPYLPLVLFFETHSVSFARCVRAGLRAVSFAGAFWDGSFGPVGPAFTICA